MAFQLATGAALLAGHWQPKLNDALRQPGRTVPLANSLAEGPPRNPPTPKDRLLTLALQVVARRAAKQGHHPPDLASSQGFADELVPFAEELDPHVLPRLIEAAGQRILLIKTHAAPSAEWIAAYHSHAQDGQVRAHVNHRDPRDICLGLLDAGRSSRERGDWEFSEFHTLEDAVRGVRKHLAELALWARLPNTLHLHYETCAFRTVEAIGRIKADLGLRCANALVEHYAMRLAYTERNKAVPNRHQSELNHRQVARLTEAFLPYLREQGYLTGRLARV